jgi:His/Glu/Gln/Arg/opine family amino acid ABC transporter permease subunit
LTLIIGIVVGVVLCGKGKVLKRFFRMYMSFFQNTPLIMQVFIFYNVLPKIGVRMDVTAIGVVGLGLYTGAYAADIVASAIRAVPFGQMEAASSQGFSHLQAMARVILPQADRPSPRHSLRGCSTQLPLGRTYGRDDGDDGRPRPIPTRLVGNRPNPDESTQDIRESQPWHSRNGGYRHDRAR